MHGNPARLRRQHRRLVLGLRQALGRVDANARRHCLGSQRVQAVEPEFRQHGLLLGGIGTDMARDEPVRPRECRELGERGHQSVST